MGELYNRNIKSNIFRGTEELTITPGVDTYDLPFDIYAVNALSSVQQILGAGAQKSFNPVRQISEKDRGLKQGYFVAKKQIIFSPYQTYLTNVLISYTKKLPKLSVSYGSILSVSPTVISLNDDYIDMSSIADSLTVVDSAGNIIVKNIGFVQTDSLLTVASTTGMTAGMIVVPGEYTSTHSELPDECESSLIFMLEKLIQARISSSDINIGSILSKEQLDQIAEMFSDNSGDSFMPPIIEYTEWA
jgi:hypothetical protein